MTFPQNTLNLNPSRFYHGQLAEPHAPKYALSRAFEDDGNDTVTAGAAVKWGTDPNKQVMVYESGDSLTSADFAGFIVLDPTRPLKSPMIADKDPVSVLRMGVIALVPGASVTAGNPVYLTLASGAYSDSAGAGKAKLPGCRWLESGDTSAARKAMVMLGGPAESAVDQAEFQMTYVVPAALTGTNAQAETFIGYARAALTLVDASIVPGGSLTADASDTATLLAYKRDSAGANQTTLASAVTTAGDTGSWTAGAREDMGVSVAAVAAGSSISVQITKQNSGVTVPAGTAIVLTFTVD